LSVKIGTVYFSGGNFATAPIVPASFPYTYKTKSSSWNIFVDPLATQRIFDSGVNIIMMTSVAQGFLPINVTSIFLYQAEFGVSNFFVNLVIYLAPCTGQTQSDIYYWDPSAAMLMEQYLIDPQNVPLCTQWTTVNGVVDLVNGGGFGRTFNIGQGGTPILTCVNANSTVFESLFWQRLSEASICPAPYQVVTTPSTENLQAQIVNLQNYGYSLEATINSLQASYNSLTGQLNSMSESVECLLSKQNKKKRNRSRY